MASSNTNSIRDGALLDVLKAIKSNKARHKKTGKSFKFKFKSRKASSDSIAINIVIGKMVFYILDFGVKNKYVLLNPFLLN